MDERGRKLNYREACALLNCGKTHFYYLIMSGILPAYRVGERRGLWVYEKDCLDHLEKCAVDPNEDHEDD